MQNQGLTAPVSTRARTRGWASADTKAQKLLETAGELFADKGFGRTTGKEICERAGVNAAAVNYYFGGIEGLYAAVLELAHERTVSVESFEAAVAGKPDPHARLRALIAKLVEVVTGPNASSWMLRLMSREFLSPAPIMQDLRARKMPPKAEILRGIVSEIMDLPDDHPAVARACLCVMAPLFVLLLGDRQALTRGFTGLSFEQKDAEATVDQLVVHAEAGLSAVARSIPKD